MALKLRKLSYALGAEVCDFDVSAPMSEAAFGDVYKAFLDNGILLFRNQDITREQHIEFSRRFGELDKHDSLPQDRHQWQNNDIVVWDNRCTLHQALGDFDETQRRHMERTTVLGTPSGYAVLGG